MFQVGLTGGIGSGKSTVAQVWARAGALIVDADAIARRALTTGKEPLERIAQRYGSRVLHSDGALNRTALADIIFTDEGERRFVEGVVHPWVRAESERVAASAEPGTIVVHDVPLLIETGRHRSMDWVVVVTAPRESRLAWLQERGLAFDDAERRIASQATDEQRCAEAHEVITNDGSLNDLRAAAQQAWQQIITVSHG